MRGCNQLLNDLRLLLIKLIANFTHPNCGNMNMNFKKETSLHLPHAVINVGEIVTTLKVRMSQSTSFFSSAPRLHTTLVRRQELIHVWLTYCQAAFRNTGRSRYTWIFTGTCTAQNRHTCSIRKKNLRRCISIHSEPAICWNSMKLVELCCFGFSIYYNLACGYFYQFSFVDIDQPIFQPYPSELVFQNFAPTQTYSLQLSLFNNDKVCKGLTNKRMGQRKHSLWTQ